VIVFGARGTEHGVIRRRLALSVNVALRVLAIDMNPLAVLGAPTMLDQQRVENRRKLGTKTQQPHPYREVSDNRPAPCGGARRAKWSHPRACYHSSLALATRLHSRWLPCLAGFDAATDE
jgi:hypothetical protein